MTTKYSGAYCFVPKCQNTKRRTPDKLFFVIPVDKKTRHVWCRAARREIIIGNTCKYCCEDHFSLENDVENWTRYKILKDAGQEVFKLKLKEGVVPHIFNCQPDRTRSHTKPPRSAVTKRQFAETLTQIHIREAAIDHGDDLCSEVQDVEMLDMETDEVVNIAAAETSHQGSPQLETSELPSYNSLSSSSLLEVSSEISDSLIDVSSLSCGSSSLGLTQPQRTQVDFGCQAKPKQFAFRSKGMMAVPSVRNEEVQTTNICKCLEEEKAKSNAAAGVSVSEPVISSSSNAAAGVSVSEPVISSSSNAAVGVSVSEPVLSSSSNAAAGVSVSVPVMNSTEDEHNTSIASISSTSNNEYFDDDEPLNISTSTVFDPNSSLPDAGCIDDGDTSSEEENACELDHHKQRIRESTLFVLEDNPRMFLGVDMENFPSLMRALTKFTKLKKASIYMALRKIRLNESNEILAKYFSRHPSTIAKSLRKSFPILATFLKSLIFWPDKEIIQSNVPLAFRAKYSKVQSIIDCFEIEIEKPGDAADQCLSWSSYKGTNTVKYLVSITPDGLINYVSVGFTGRGSDPEVIKMSGFYEQLKKGTCVMADRGFKFIETELKKINCSVELPDSVSKDTKLSKDKVQHTKSIASLRINVERVIRRIREYKMCSLHACFNHNLLSVVDYAVVIACALVNLQGPLIR